MLMCAPTHWVIDAAIVAATPTKSHPRRSDLCQLCFATIRGANPMGMVERSRTTKPPRMRLLLGAPLAEWGTVLQAFLRQST